jgi:hypothetical protein
MQVVVAVVLMEIFKQVVVMVEAAAVDRQVLLIQQEPLTQVAEVEVAVEIMQVNLVVQEL